MNIFSETKGQGDDIVLLHGNCDDHYAMQPIMDTLCNHYRVTNLDQPGRGKSPWQPQMTNIHDIADALLPVLPEKATYINWSFGGLIALSIAARYPNRVKRLISIGSSPKFIEDENWPSVPKPGFQVVIPLIKEKGLAAFLQASYDVEFSNIDPKPEMYHTLIKKSLESNNDDLNAIEKRIFICDRTDLRKEFQNLNCPIDLILGEKDAAVPLTLHQKIKSLNLKANLHIIPDAQHMFHWTHPVEFNSLLNSILASN